MNLTAVILTKNASAYLSACLTSLSWCPEILVIDDQSNDTTGEIAKRHKAKVIVHPLQEDFAAQRNFALSQTATEWVFFIDADEQVSAHLAEEIRSLTTHNSSLTTGYYLKRIDYMWGKPLLHGEQGNTILLRLAKKTGGKWKGRVHETWRIEGQTGVLQNPLYHYPHQTIAEFLSEINFYTSLRAKELFEKGERVSWWQIIVYPKAKFFQDFFLKMGFLDGTAGFIVALLMSFHSFLVRGKVWQLQENK